MRLLTNLLLRSLCGPEFVWLAQNFCCCCTNALHCTQGLAFGQFNCYSIYFEQKLFFFFFSSICRQIWSISIIFFLNFGFGYLCCFFLFMHCTLVYNVNFTSKYDMSHASIILDQFISPHFCMHKIVSYSSRILKLYRSIYFALVSSTGP